MSEYDFTEIARIAATRKNIRDCKLEYQYSTNKGDGYTGSVRAVKLVGSNKQLDAVFKYSHRDPKAHEALPLHQMYTSEITFYEEIVPAYKQFQAEYDVKEPFDNYVEYYGSINTPLYECVAMENVKNQNYDLWDRKMEMNQSHLEMALKAFAKLHGTSMAMKKLKPEIHAKLVTVPKLNNMADMMQKNDSYKQVRGIISTLDNFDPITDLIYTEKLSYFHDNIVELMTPILNHRDSYDVILQGDCWCNNAMYFYKDINDRSKPQGIKLLDWQLVGFGPLVHDLTYFFYSIASKESVDQLDHYLKIYHDTLGNHLRSFGLDVEKVYSFETFMEQWKKLALNGLLLAFLVRKIVLVESEDAPDVAEDIDNFVSNMRFSEDKEKLYKQQMKTIFMHMVDRQFL